MSELLIVASISVEAIPGDDAQTAPSRLATSEILPLQEVSRGMVEPLRRELSEVGFPHSVDSFAVAPSWDAQGPRRCGLMIAARSPSTEVGVCWPERLLSVVVATPSGPLLLHTTHIPPGSSNGATKMLILEGVLAVVAAAHPSRQILCGDLNLPQLETVEGRIVTWAERVSSAGTIKIREGGEANRHRGGIRRSAV